MSEMLGHTEIGITLKFCSHVTPAKHESASWALGRLLGQSGRSPAETSRPASDR